MEFFKERLRLVVAETVSRIQTQVHIYEIAVPNPDAKLLRNIDWTDINQISKINIADIACGSGTLLKACLDDFVEKHINECVGSNVKPQTDKLVKQLVEKIQSHIPNTSVNYSDYYVDPDKRDYIVSNKKIEETGWKPLFTLDDGIKDCI